MTTVHYEAQTRRLRIEGACLNDDRSAVREALEAFAELVAGGHLIVDLTAVTDIDQTVADDLLAAARAASSRGRGGTFTFLRKAGPVDDAFTAAEAHHPLAPRARWVRPPSPRRGVGPWSPISHGADQVRRPGGVF